MSIETIQSIEKPDIVMADTGPLIHLSQAKALHLLHEIGGSVIIDDMVRYEATGNLAKPEAAAAPSTNPGISTFSQRRPRLLDR